MTDVIIIYDSMTGNTEKAAALVLEGVRSAGASGEMKRAGEAKPVDVARARGVVLGSYCLRDGCSQAIDVFLSGSVPAALKDKPGAAFGSYKFSGGQVRKLEAEMTSLGARIVSPGRQRALGSRRGDGRAAARAREKSGRGHQRLDVEKASRRKWSWINGLVYHAATFTTQRRATPTTASPRERHLKTCPKTGFARNAAHPKISSKR